MRSASKGAAFVAALFICTSTWGLDRAQVEKLASDDNDDKIAAIAALVAEGDPKAADVLKQAAEGEITIDGKKVEVVMNNRVRGAHRGGAVDPEVTFAREKRKAGSRKGARQRRRCLDAALVLKAKEKETEPDIKAMLEMTAAGMQIRSEDQATRLAAIRMLGASGNPVARALLTEAASDADAEIRSEAQTQPERRAVAPGVGRMARARLRRRVARLDPAARRARPRHHLRADGRDQHGARRADHDRRLHDVRGAELLQRHAAFDYYLLAAVPAAFLVSAFIGMILERSVIRWLYGRPLETLLATWGISLVLIQAVRTIFGAQNVQVENPAFMSGGIQVLANVVMPWSRIWIIVFAACVLVGLWLLLSKTRLGLFIRGVTQNRDMAACVGVPTARIDTWAFGLGSGIAGLAGCALSQLGNVGPDLGQGYIVDSFLVVVFGGVGQLAGTVYAALGLGFANKLLESWSGAVLAKIALLVFIIIFIQRRPQGLFALRAGRWKHEHARTRFWMRRRHRQRDRVHSLSDPEPRRAAGQPVPPVGVLGDARRQDHVLRDRGARARPGLGLCRDPVARPRPVLRARRLRHGHVPHAPDRARGPVPVRPARLHGVPRLEGAALAVVGLGAFPLGAVPRRLSCRESWPSCSATSRSARA